MKSSTRTTMNGGNSSLNMKFPLFDVKNWNRWMIQMCVLFGTQDVLDLANEGYAAVVVDATKAQRNAYRELRKKDHKALFCIHQCVDENVIDSMMVKVA